MLAPYRNFSVIQKLWITYISRRPYYQTSPVDGDLPYVINPSYLSSNVNPSWILQGDRVPGYLEYFSELHLTAVLSSVQLSARQMIQYNAPRATLNNSSRLFFSGIFSKEALHNTFHSRCSLFSNLENQQQTVLGAVSLECTQALVRYDIRARQVELSLQH